MPITSVIQPKFLCVTYQEMLDNESIYPVGSSILITETQKEYNYFGEGTYKLAGYGVTAAVTFTTIEVNLGNQRRRSGKFSITSSGLTIGKQVMIYQASGPYTGKGTLADESEMDGITVNGLVTSSTNIDCYWNCQTFVIGNFKFNYLINS